jgi:hypothetical protein
VANQSVSQSASQPASQPASQSVSQPVSQSVRQSAHAAVALARIAGKSLQHAQDTRLQGVLLPLQEFQARARSMHKIRTLSCATSPISQRLGGATATRHVLLGPHGMQQACPGHPVHPSASRSLHRNCRVGTSKCSGETGSPRPACCMPCFPTRKPTPAAPTPCQSCCCHTNGGTTLACRSCSTAHML